MDDQSQQAFALFAAKHHVTSTTILCVRALINIAAILRSIYVLNIYVYKLHTYQTIQIMVSLVIHPFCTDTLAIIQFYADHTQYSVANLRSAS